MRKVTEVRELRQRNEADMRINMMEKLKERLNSTDKLKEEKLKEEREKQRMRWVICIAWVIVHVYLCLVIELVVHLEQDLINMIIYEMIYIPIHLGKHLVF